MALIPAIAAGGGSAVVLLILLVTCCQFRCKKTKRETNFELLEESQTFINSQDASVLRNRGRGTALSSTVIITLCVFLLSLFFFCNFVIGESNSVEGLGPTMSWTREAGLVYFAFQGQVIPMPIVLQLICGLILFSTLSFYVHIMTLWYNFETFEYATEYDRDLLFERKTRRRWIFTSLIYYLLPLIGIPFGFLWHLVIYPLLEPIVSYQIFFLIQALSGWLLAMIVRIVASRVLNRTFPKGSLAYDQKSISLNCNAVVATVYNFIGPGLILLSLPSLAEGKPIMPAWEQFRALEILVLMVPVSLDASHWFYRGLSGCCAWRDTHVLSITPDLESAMSAISFGMIFGWLQPSILGISAGTAAFCLLSGRIRNWVCEYRRSSVLACLGMLRCIFHAWLLSLPLVVKSCSWVYRYDSLVWAKWLPCFGFVTLIFFAFWFHLGRSANRRYLNGSSFYVREMASHIESCCWRTSW